MGKKKLNLFLNNYFEVVEDGDMSYAQYLVGNFIREFKLLEC